MSRCHQTDALLDVIFAGSGLTGAQADHAVGCAECAHALAQARRFDGELQRIGAELLVEPTPAAAELNGLSTPTQRGEWMMTARRSLIVGVGTAAVIAIALLGGRAISGVGGLPELFTLPLTVREAAAALGVPEDAVVLTDDGAVAVRFDTDGLVQLVAISGAIGREQQVLNQIDLPNHAPESSGIASMLVRCDESLAGEFYAMFGLSWPYRMDASVPVAAVQVQGLSGETRASVIDVPRLDFSGLGWLVVVDPADAQPDGHYEVKIGPRGPQAHISSGPIALAEDC